MSELLSISKKLHTALTIYNGAGHALGWKTAKIDALLDESKRIIEATPPAAQPAVPEGWKLVPVGAVPEIMGAAMAVHDKWGWRNFPAMWDAMLSAAPTPPAAPVQCEWCNGRGVLAGMCYVICYEKNQFLDPGKDYLALHPDVIEGLELLKKHRADFIPRLVREARAAVAHTIEAAAARHLAEMAETYRGTPNESRI